MHFSSLLPTLTVLTSLVSAAPSVYTTPKDLKYPAHLPKTCEEFKKHTPYHYPPANRRKQFHIRASKHDNDDISAELLKGFKAANHGGTLVLEKGKKYVIGKPLDLTFLNDFQLQLDGTLQVIDMNQTHKHGH